MPTTITVPDEIADEVRRFAAFVTAERASRGIESFTVAALHEETDPDYPLWSDEDVIALANAGTTTARNYRAIMNSILDERTVGQWVSLDDLSEWTGIKRSVLSTFRTHLYRYVNTHLPADSHAPFTGRWGTELRPARGREVFYRVSSECAEQWKRIQPRLTELS